MARRCCRDTPRCHDCPVRLAAARRAAALRAVAETGGSGMPAGLCGAHPAADPRALVEEILTGSAPRALPPGVAAALAQVEAARRGPPPLLLP